MLGAARSLAGFTLIEMVLALSLAVIIVGALGIALRNQSRLSEEATRQVEEAQLARAILATIADDLRSTLAHHPVDFSNLDSINPAAGIAQTGGGTTGVSLGEGEAEEEEEEDDEEEETPNPTEGIADGNQAPAIPGLYGNQYELQIDVSRLPRINEYFVSPGASGATSTNHPSDVKTVAYYLMDQPLQRQGTLPAGNDALENGSSLFGGLVRRSIDRTIYEFASQQGDSYQLAAGTKILAPEVIYLEFRYFDGKQWLATWNTEEQQGLPPAIEIAIALRGDHESRADESERPGNRDFPPVGETVGSNSALGQITPDRIFRQTVTLPTGVPVSDEQSQGEEQP